MTADIWSRYLMNWDAQLRMEGRFFLLLADNAPGHKEVTLTNIHVEYMPKNTTSLIQPADAGIIKCFKGYYRNLTVQKCLYMVEEKKAMGLTVLGSDMEKKITVLDAIHMAIGLHQQLRSELQLSDDWDWVDHDLEDLCASSVSIKAITVGALFVTDTSDQ